MCFVDGKWYSRHVYNSILPTLSLIEPFVFFPLPPLCPPLPADKTHMSCCVYSTCSCCPVVEGGFSVFPYPPDTQGASTTANGQQQLQGEGEGRGGAAPTDTAEHCRTSVNIMSKLDQPVEMCVVL